MPITNIIASAIITAYISTGNPCANGSAPKASHTIAAPRSIPLGSKVILDGKSYVVEDRTARRFDGRFDIFMSSKKEALEFGKQTNTVKVIIYESRK